MKRLALSLAFPLLGVLAIGCGGAEGDTGRAETYETTGKITFDGKPVEDATVTFSPTGTQPPAVGRTDPEGNYSLRTYEDGDGAAAGDYTVLVMKETVTAAAAPTHDEVVASGGSPQAHSGAPGASTTKSELPTKYSSQATSDLKATVTEDGENNFDFNLEK